jgi:hypothetical protein
MVAVKEDLVDSLAKYYLRFDRRKEVHEPAYYCLAKILVTNCCCLCQASQPLRVYKVMRYGRFHMCPLSLSMMKAQCCTPLHQPSRVDSRAAKADTFRCA